VDLVVGFDLDMTLVDSRAGIAETLKAATADLGVSVTDADIWPTIGIPLPDALAQLMPADQVELAMAAYRASYPTIGVPITTLLPGAPEALAAVRALGGRTAIISAKSLPGVEAVLTHVGLEADVVIGGRYAHGKASVLRELGAQI
jgi:phosphoglycolate phosphatase